MKTRTKFLNVDLEVYGEKSLRPLVGALESAGAVALHSGRWHEGGYFASFELEGRTTSAERTVRGLTRIVQALEGKARSIWERATRRVFNIGIEAGDGPHSFAVAVSPAALRRVAELDAEIEVTVYAAERARV